jgi:AcrR family transcriptional regulator
MGERAPRGRYAKSDATRTEILRVALEAYARSGRQGPSLRSIAEAVGLSEAGVLHHFASKDHLLVAVLEERDDDATRRHDLDSLAGLLDYIVETTRTPGLVKLFVDLTAASADPDHPAAAFMERHRRGAEERMLALLGPGHERDAQVLVAAAEGLQIQWMRDPSVDIAGELGRLFRLLAQQT